MLDPWHHIGSPEHSQQLPQHFGCGPTLPSNSNNLSKESEEANQSPHVVIWITEKKSEFTFDFLSTLDFDSHKSFLFISNKFLKITYLVFKFFGLVVVGFWGDEAFRATSSIAQRLSICKTNTLSNVLWHWQRWPLVF